MQGKPTSRCLNYLVDTVFEFSLLVGEIWKVGKSQGSAL
jgi:hypothetical protein